MAISPSRPRIVDFVAWSLLAIALIFAIYVRVRLRAFPLERDEGEFAYAGQLILQGVPPYKLAYNMKLPGTYIAYAALMAVFGQTTSGHSPGTAGRESGNDRAALSLRAGAFRSFLGRHGGHRLCDPVGESGPLGMAAHATHFVAFFGLAGTYLLWRHLQWGRWWLLLSSGFLLGTAFLMKQQGFFLMVFGGAVVAVHTLAGLVRASREPQPGTTSSLKLILQAAAFCITVVLPYGIVCLWLWRAGVFDKFWFWTVTYTREYVGEIPLAYAWQSFRQGEGSRVIVADWTAWTLALVGCVGVAYRYRARPGRALFLFCFLLCSFLCVSGFLFSLSLFRRHAAGCRHVGRHGLRRLLAAGEPVEAAVCRRAGCGEGIARKAEEVASQAGGRAGRGVFAVDDSGSTGRAGDGRLADLAVPGVLLPVAAGDCLPQLIPAIRSSKPP